MVSQTTQSYEIFYSYAHEDEALRDELEKHLAPLKRQGLITGWHDRKIPAGMAWSDEIDTHLKSANLILLLISADFIASSYCYGVEMKQALQRHENGEAHVIPIILRPVDWTGTPFAKLQALPRDAQPVVTWSPIDSAFFDIAQGIRNLVEEQRKAKHTQRPSAHTQQELASLTPTLPAFISGSKHSATPPQCPFHAESIITTHSLFVGRKPILQEMIGFMTNPQPTSINIFGEKGIGKSSLLHYFYQTWEQRGVPIDRYVVLYIPLAQRQYHSQQNFYHTITKKLREHPQVQAKAQLKKGLEIREPNELTFEALCDQWEQEQVLLVLCLDDIEVWLNDYPQEFDDNFLTHLRSLTNHNKLMLIVTSLHPLSEYRKKHQRESPFFNNGLELRLEGFSDNEITELLSRSASTTPDTKVALKEDEQNTARCWGGHHPRDLQLAARVLWQAQQQGKDQTWAKLEFEKERKRISYTPPPKRRARTKPLDNRKQ